MLKHCVFLHFKPEYSTAEQTAVLRELAGLTDVVEGLVSVEYGENLDFEGKSPDYGQGFIATFTNSKALEQYASHPEHQRLGHRLVEMCVGGADGIIVFDLDV